MVWSKASRNALTRSSGTPGVVKIGRPMAEGAERSLRTALSSGVLARSARSGTSWRSGALVSPIWTRMLIFLSRSQSGRVPFHDAQLLLPRPETSPRSMARLMSLPPG